MSGWSSLLLSKKEPFCSPAHLCHLLKFFLSFALHSLYQCVRTVSPENKVHVLTEAFHWGTGVGKTVETKATFSNRIFLLRLSIIPLVFKHRWFSCLFYYIQVVPSWQSNLLCSTLTQVMFTNYIFFHGDTKCSPVLYSVEIVFIQKNTTLI